MKKVLSWLLLGGFVLAQISVLAPRLFVRADETHQIALVGPLSGPDAELGQAMMAGAELMVERYNRTRPAGQKRIELSTHDDANDPEKARQIAIELAEDSVVLAVLGHLSDETSAAAGPVYAEKGLPAISGSSGTPEVTAKNDWFFRAGLTTGHQGVILTHYMARVLGEEKLLVISSDDSYGRSLLSAVEYEQSFIKRLGLSQLELKKKWSFDPKAEDLDKALDPIVDDLAKSYSKELVLLAVSDSVAAPLIRKLQDNPRKRFGKTIPYRIIGGDSLGQPGLPMAFAELRREKYRPGVYTDGIRAVAPFLEDVANQKAQDFRQAFEERHGRPAGVIAAGYHDAAASVAQAMQRLTASPSDLKVARKEVRDNLARLDAPQRSVTGVTGSLYFDSRGNAIKTIPIGVYRERRLVSPPLQLSAVRSITGVSTKDVYQIQGNYFSPTRIVHTGVQVNEISDIDLDLRRATLDFNIWFRFSSDMKLGAIEFPNAVEPIDLGAPIEESDVDGQRYRLHRVKGAFKSDFTAGGDVFGKRLLGVQVRHRDLNRERLILVADLIGMADGKGGSLSERISRKTVWGELSDWTVKQADIFLDTEPVAVMGNPQFAGRDVPGFSRFNLGVRLESTDLSLRGMIAYDLALDLFLICGVALGFLAVGASQNRSERLLAWLWFPQTGLCLTMLFCGEAVVLDWLTRDVGSAFHTEVASYVFQIAWWMVPAWLFNLAVERFFWTPLERRTAREIPPVVRGFTAGLVYILAMMGIVAFVFDQKVTSLLATSGVLAMIVGLAIQMNLSNIFSGIAINMERPFRMGDWIRVAAFDPGKVVGITWRTTRIETLDKNIICIPNSVASDSSVENLSYPREHYRSEQLVHVDPGAKPEWVEKILYDAVVSATGILRDPEPSVVFHGVKDWSAEYAVRFFCEDYEQSITVDAEVWRLIVRNLRYAGFESVIHEEFTLFHLRDADQEGRRQMTAELLIDDVEVFQPFDKDKKDLLIRNMDRLQLEPARTVVTEGEDGDSLFIVAEGAMKVEMEVEDDESIEVGRLGPGDFFGEMALLTGEPRRATVSTLTPSLIFEIAKEDLQPILVQFPEISDDLSQVLTRRTLENLRRRNDHYATLDEEKSLARNLLNKISRFFQIGTREEPAPRRVAN